MAVTIQLDVDATGATGKIGAVAASLKGLERIADDIDIDFDADIGDITDEIEAFSDALEGINLDMESLGNDVRKAAKELDGAEVSVVADTPDGSTNKGDSTGADPPDGLVHKLNEFGDEIDTSAASATDGGERANLFERAYGPDAIPWSDSDSGNIFKTRNTRQSNLGEHASTFSPTDRLGSDVATRSGFGLELESMNLRRLADDISMEGFERAGDPSHRSVKTPFERRIEESDLITQSLQEIEQHQKELLDEVGIKDGQVGNTNDFMDFNQEARENLSSSERLDLYRNAEASGGLPDFDQVGRRSGRSNADIIKGNRVLRRVDNITSLGDAMGELSNIQAGLGKKFRKLRPTMGQYMQLLAAIIPIAVALGTQLLGVAAAMGSVAVAGGAIMGLGLLGHGESMSESFAQAKQELRDLKSEMFEATQPLAQQFAPMQSRMFDAIPEGMGGIFEEMEGLTQFEDTLFELGAALAGGIEEFFAIINRNADAIDQLATKFGGLIGSGLLEFFEFLIQSASENQGLLISLGQDMIKLVVAFYNVSMAVSKVLTAFTPLFNLMVLISELLNSEIIIGLITMAGWLFVLGKAAGVVYALSGAFMTLTAGVADAVYIMFAYEMSTWGAVAATLALVAAIGLLTLGAATVIGGAVTAGTMGASDTPTGPGGGGGVGGGPGGGGGGMVYNDNRSYNIQSGGGDDYASQKKMEDTVRQVNETNSAQELPSVETSSRESDSEDDN